MRPVVLYDGLCGFCDVAVGWILEHDRGGIFRFAPLQGQTAEGIRARHPELPPGLDSLVLVTGAGADERVAWHAAAVFGIVERLPAPWRAVAWCAILPRAFTDWAYRTFARVRYRVWGRRESCRIPSVAERARFLP